MKKDLEVIEVTEEQAFKATLKVAESLGDVVEELALKSVEERTQDDYNNMIDLADAQTKCLAVYHKGREVSIKKQHLLGDPSLGD